MIPTPTVDVLDVGNGGEWLKSELAAVRAPLAVLGEEALPGQGSLGSLPGGSLPGEPWPPGDRQGPEAGAAGVRAEPGSQRRCPVPCWLQFASGASCLVQ